MSEYGEGLYAKVADKVRSKFIPSHLEEDFNTGSIMHFFEWERARNVLGSDGKPIDKAELRYQLSKVLDNFTEGREPLIKRIGRRGWFRAVIRDVEELDWRSKRGAPTLDLKWPFQLEDYALLYPGSLALIAGTSNAGKTAFCHNFLSLNLYQFECHLWTSDMSEEELADRLDPFDIPEDAPFHPHPRASDFADVIKKDCINVVDYLEYIEHVSEIKQEIEQIYRTMIGGRGMVLTAIQKKFNQKNMKGEMVKRDLGYGAETTLSRPKLYLTLNPNSLMITKAKKRADKNVNPNNKKWTFQLVDGAHFINILEDEEWF